MSRPCAGWFRKPCRGCPEADTEVRRSLSGGIPARTGAAFSHTPELASPTRTWSCSRSRVVERASRTSTQPQVATEPTGSTPSHRLIERRSQNLCFALLRMLLNDS